MSDQRKSTRSDDLDVSRGNDTTASAILAVLLASDYHGPWTRAEIERELSGSAIEVQDALAELRGAGLIHVHDELVFSSRAARRMDELEV